MKICLSIFVCMLIGAVSCGSSVTKPTFTKKYHLITTFKASWYRALHHCLANSMKFASITSAKENDEVLQLIRESGIIDYFWIGATRQGNGNDFYWIGNNKAFTFSDWHTGEPSNGNGQEECISFKNDANVIKWNDWSCWHTTYFVCEEEVWVLSQH